MKSIKQIISDNKAVLTFLAIVLACSAVVFLVDYGVGQKQDAIIKEKKEKRRRLEIQAFNWISVEARDIGYAPDVEQSQQYEVTLGVDSVADEPVYVSHPVVKAYMQTGKISWIELPIIDKPGSPMEQMYKIEDKRLKLKKVITIDRNIPYNRYLIRKYMHIKLVFLMYVLPESGFKEGEVVERKSSSFIYLKPYYVSELEIRDVIDWGKTEVPVYMPITSFRNWDED